ncbi:MAG: HEAT repeat domain-containing protein [Planctomycetota bacterium]
MKKYLVLVLLICGLMLVNYLFSAIPDNDWKKELATFTDAYGKAKTPSERAIAIRKIAEADHPGVVRVLAGTALPKELKENELLNVDIVATALSKLSDPAAIDELVATAKKAATAEKVILIRAMGRISNEGVGKLLLELLKNNDNLVKAAAIDALSESLPAEALDTILGFLDSKSWEVKVSAVYYLAKLTDEEAKSKALNILRTRLPKETGRIRNDMGEAINQLSLNSDPANDKMGGTFSFFDIPLEGDVVFVLDASASMEGKNKDGINRWDKLVEQFKLSVEMMAKAKPAVKFNIVGYAERVGKFKDGLVPVAENKEAAIKWLDSIKPGGMMAPGKLGGLTNIYDAVEMALIGQSAAGSGDGQKIVITSGVPNAYTICLMTDGKASKDKGKYSNPDDILAALRILNQTRKIRINTIALDLGVAEANDASGMGAMFSVDAELMERIANEHHGTCKKF